MALLPTPNTDFTDKDFDSLKLRLQNLIRSVFPEWTDYNVANFGNLLLELFAHVGDVLTFYQDNQARQSRITTATQRRALLGLIKLIGYTAATATPAQVDVTITLPAIPAGSVTFPAGTFVYTDEVTDPIRYQLLSDAVIAAAQNPASVTVTAEHSEPQDDVFSTSGLPNQSFLLSKSPFIDGSASPIAGNGAYTQVENFFDSGPTDKHFTVSVDQNDRATILFGNGVNGAIPVGNLTITYKTGGGIDGRVEAGKLRRIDGTFTDSLGNPVTPSVTNALKSAGGTDRQSVAQIKQRAPASLRVLTRTVSREDFEVNALRLTDIARALMSTSNEDPGVPENSGILYIIPVGGGQPTLAQKNAVLAQVTTVYPRTLTFSIVVQGALFKTIDIFAIVYLKDGAGGAATKAAILAALTSFFAVQNVDGTNNENVDFGGNMPELALSDVFNAIRDVAGVRKIGAGIGDFLLNGAYDDIALASQEFPALGTVTLINGDTGNPLV